MDGSLTLLVDTSSLLFRAYYSIPDSVRAADGTLMNAAYGFLDMLARLVSDLDPDYLCCATDEDWRPEWRVELIDSYKAQRAEPGSTQEQAEDQLEPQVPVLFEILALCGVPVLGHPGYEAEDVIGTLAERAPGRVAIISGDRDLFQLVRDPKIVVLYPKRGVSVMDRVDEAFIEARYGIPGRAYRDFALLRGDPSDGLPGVRGIGEKLASGLVARHGSIEAIVAASADSESGPLHKVRGSLDYIERALKVVTIPTDLPLPEVDLTRPRHEPDERVYPLAQQHALAGATNRLVQALAAPAG